MTISRGGCTMKIVKSTNFGVPPIVIGTHLDQVFLWRSWTNIRATQKWNEQRDYRQRDKLTEQTNKQAARQTKWKKIDQSSVWNDIVTNISPKSTSFQPGGVGDSGQYANWHSNHWRNGDYECLAVVVIDNILNNNKLQYETMI